MTRFAYILALLALLASPAALAQEAPASDTQSEAPRIYFDSSDTDVPLNITYNGHDILIYGAIQNNSNLDPDLIITVAGPSENYVVLKKGRKAGMWINTESVNFRNVPSFLAISSDAPLDTIILPTERIRFKIGFEQKVRIRGLAQNIEDPQAFVNAFVNLQRRDRKYVLDEDGIKVSGNVLFSTRIPLAADIVEGNYKVEILLLQKGRVVASVESDLAVHKSGIERWLYDLAENNGFLYGFLAIFLAVFVAFAVSQFMRLFQR